MGLETGTYISDLNSSNPVGASDPKSQGDDHLRLIKSTLLATFPSITGAVSLTHTQINDAAIKGEANTFTENQRITTTAPALELYESDAGADEKLWQLIADADKLTVRTRTDANGAGADALLITRTGTAITAIQAEATDINLKGNLNVLDSTEADSLTISHDGTDANITGTNTTDVNMSGFDALKVIADILVQTGHSLELWDSTNTDRMEVLHNGTDVDVIFTNTGAIKYRDGVELRIYDSSDADYFGISHDGTDVLFQFQQTGVIKVLDGTPLRLYDATEADYLSLTHDGTNASIDTNAGGLDFNSLSITSDNDTADEPGWKGSPQNVKSANYTLVLGDAGKQIYLNGGSSQTLTIPANSSVAFPIGTIIIVINDSTNDWSIAITTDTLEKYGGSTGTQTLSDNAKAVIEKVTSTLWKYASTD